MLGALPPGNRYPMKDEAIAGCANCGAALPSSARFCPTCGVVAAAGSGDTLRAPGRGEAGAAPLAERRVFGAVPATTTLVLALALSVLGVVVLVAGHLLLGVALLAIGIAGLALSVEALRRRPRGRFGQAAQKGMLRLGERASFLFGSADAWSQAGREVVRLRAELHRLERERRQTQYELGGATYARDAERTSALIERLHALDGRADECGRASEAATARARERIARDRRTIEPTEIVRAPASDDSGIASRGSDPRPDA